MWVVLYAWVVVAFLSSLKKDQVLRQHDKCGKDMTNREVSSNSFLLFSVNQLIQQDKRVQLETWYEALRKLNFLLSLEGICRSVGVVWCHKGR